MAENFSAVEALDTLRNRLEQDGEASQYIAAFRTKAGRHLALERDQKGVRLWLEKAPPEELTGVALSRRYQASDPRNSNLNGSRGSRLAKGKPAVQVTIASPSALDELISWYDELGAEPTRKALCLIGTWRGLDQAKLGHVSQFVSEHGGWASWWSFRIKDEALSLLKMPFWLYLNRGGDSIIARCLVAEMASASEPIVSPWPLQTEPHLIGKTTDGDGPSGVCKTWLRVTEIENLPSPLSKSDFEPAEGLSKDTSLLNQSTFGYAYLKSTRNGGNREETMSLATTAMPLNTILYGPPGTSKTYESIDYALKIIDPHFYAQNAQSRAALKKRFDALRTEGRIEFVTFHQSYGYEDFVEGIRAGTEEDRITYQVEDGVFKRLCERAATTGGDDKFREAIDQFKKEVAEDPAVLKTKKGKEFLVTWRGGKTLRLKPYSSQAEGDYPVSIENIERAYRGEDEEGFYNVSYVRAVLAHVIDKWKVPKYTEAAARKPYVLIIDEINRGNIASIFGELITLIEPSKRDGAAEALSAVLPYSKRSVNPFTVPDNLYIVGTMNTADRSLARVDTALRRRFDFVPMYPRPEELDGVEVDGVDLGRLLRRLNDRIELLYDRDHLIGHAFFMGMKEKAEKRTLQELALVFRNKVMPLLEEYFFEDWQKIRLILADNQKASTDNQFVIEEDLTTSSSLFGDAEVGTMGLRYRRNDAALLRAESYRQIYG